ncbi:MAG: hypothetical protein LBP21_06425 [Synergistaceae bacterium]|jgi:hypothetical protein|nr:hypothetical protein [Synergistaceae bacterium]
MKYDPCDYPTMNDLRRIREEIYEEQKHMSLAERVADTAQRGEEALKRLELDATAKRLGK